MPIGCFKRSYAYASNGSMISNASFSKKKLNSGYEQGDTIGIFMHLLAPKPKFMRKKDTKLNEDFIAELTSYDPIVAKALYEDKN